MINPEILLAKDEFSQKEVVKGYFNVLFFRDIMERFRVDNEPAMQYLIKSLTLSFTKEINIHKVFNDLKSQGIKLSITAIYEYYEHLKSTFYGYELVNFYSVLRGRKKWYLYNVGFHSLFNPSPDFGQSFENLLFLELQKKFDRVFFKKGAKKREKKLNKTFQIVEGEIDFYIQPVDTAPQKKEFHIQACYQLNQKDFERELSPLQNVEGERYIVYFEKDTPLPEEVDGVKIIHFFDFVNAYL